LLRKNCADLQGFNSLQCGIWSESCVLHVRSESAGSAWGLQFEPVPGASDGVAGHSVATLIDLLPGKYCDLLKLDIEGAETEVFSEGSLDWISRAAVILVETHGELARNVVTRVAEARGFHIAPVGDKIMLWRKAIA